MAVKLQCMNDFARDSAFMIGKSRMHTINMARKFSDGVFSARGNSAQHASQNSTLDAGISLLQ